MRQLLGDNSAAVNKNQSDTLKRLETLYSIGEDAILDLRSNNGATPKYEAFWDVVSNHIDTHTASDDRRNDGVTSDGDVTVNIALAARVIR